MLAISSRRRGGVASNRAPHGPHTSNPPKPSPDAQRRSNVRLNSGCVTWRVGGRRRRSRRLALRVARLRCRCRVLACAESNLRGRMCGWGWVRQRCSSALPSPTLAMMHPRHCRPAHAQTHSPCARPRIRWSSAVVIEQTYDRRPALITRHATDATPPTPRHRRHATGV
jgi:hypothetical protein